MDGRGRGECRTEAMDVHPEVDRLEELGLVLEALGRRKTCSGVGAVDVDCTPVHLVTSAATSAMFSKPVPLPTPNSSTVRRSIPRPWPGGGGKMRVGVMMPQQQVEATLARNEPKIQTGTETRLR